MTDAAKLYTRCLLLLLAVGVFLAVWSGDRPALETRPTASDAVAREADAPVIGGETVRADGPVVTAAESCDVATCPAEAGASLDADSFAFPDERCFETGPIAEVRFVDRNSHDESHWTSCEIPLPTDIAAGEYRAVSSTGQVKTVLLTADDLAYHGIPDVVPPRHSYVFVDGRVRWYFVRIDRAAPDASFVRDDRPTVPAAGVPRTRTVSVDLAGLADTVGDRLQADVRLLTWRFGELVDRMRRRLTAWTRPATGDDVTVETLREWLGPAESSPRLSAEEAPTAARRN